MIVWGLHPGHLGWCMWVTCCGCVTLGVCCCTGCMRGTGWLSLFWVLAAACNTASSLLRVGGSHLCMRKGHVQQRGINGCALTALPSHLHGCSCVSHSDTPGVCVCMCTYQCACVYVPVCGMHVVALPLLLWVWCCQELNAGCLRVPASAEGCVSGCMWLCGCERVCGIGCGCACVGAR